jgi:hypothetical protein
VATLAYAGEVGEWCAADTPEECADGPQTTRALNSFGTHMLELKSNSTPAFVITIILYMHAWFAHISVFECVVVPRSLLRLRFRA